ncbi:MAG: single-stranded DNA-binding protein [Bacilli bacterium]|nr:single-stranded DNA-binding protein [Bacilli bacterium]
MLVGRTTDDIKVNTTSDGKKVATITLAVIRPFKSAETGEYETDFIPVVLWEGIVESMASLVKKGSTIGVKGRLVMKYLEINDQKYRTIEMIGERVTYINLKSSSQNEDL